MRKNLEDFKTQNNQIFGIIFLNMINVVIKQIDLNIFLYINKDLPLFHQNNIYCQWKTRKTFCFLNMNTSKNMIMDSCKRI